MKAPNYHEHVAGAPAKFQPRKEDTVEFEQLAEPAPEIHFIEAPGIEVTEERFDSQASFHRRIDELLGGGGR